MDQIKVEKLGEDELKAKGIFDWPVWEKEVSQFPWSYDQTEECYILEGKATVTPDSGDPVEFGVGDYVTFPKGINCTWNITTPVKKHYRFS